ncbi:MAG: membrane lipoprotein lipid attachment site-containing protein [Planctomycetota bacterium]|jgi:hypothetical protein
MKRITILLLIVLALSSCQPIEYGTVQREFERAVQVDNSRVVSPFTDGTADFSAVLKKLTPEHIEKLDTRLQANAWVLRGISAWRSGEWKTATDASKEGLKLNPPAGSRDAALLTMLPGLVFESQTLEMWAAVPVKNEDEYNKLRDDMSSAWKALVMAEKTFNVATPASTKYYLHYQKWRVAMNWAQMILDADRDTARRQDMNNWARDKGGVGATPGTAANDAKAKVKGPLRDLIDAQSR